MNEILFVVEEADDGSYRASAVGAAIHTEADSLTATQAWCQTPAGSRWCSS